MTRPENLAENLAECLIEFCLTLADISSRDWPHRSSESRAALKDNSLEDEFTVG